MEPKQQSERGGTGQTPEHTRGSIESQPSSRYWDQLTKEEQQTFGSREEFERQYPVSQQGGEQPKG